MHYRISPLAILLALISSSTYAQETTTATQATFSAPRPMEQNITTSLTAVVGGTTLTALSGTRTETSEDSTSLTSIVGTNTNAQTPSSGSTIAVLTTSTSAESTAGSQTTAAETTTSSAGVAGMEIMGRVEQVVMLGLGAGAAFVI